MAAVDHTKRLQAYDRALFSESIKSLFWGIIRERKKRGKFTMQSVADAANTDKGKVSRDFSGSPNLTANTIADYASALGVDLEIQARDRETGAIYTSRGLTSGVYALATSTRSPFSRAVAQPESGGLEIEVRPVPHGMMQTRAAVG